MSENNQQQHPVTPTHSWGVITEVEGGFNGAPAQHEPQSIHQWRRVDKPELGWFDDTHERAYHADPKLEGRTLYSTPQPAQQKPVECQYGKGGYACCEGGPCKADEQNNAPRPAQPQQEPDAYLHDDGCWTAAKTYAGRQLNDRLLFAGSPKIGVYTLPPAQPVPEGKQFQAKFNIEDRVWYMKNNKPTEVVISAIEVFFVNTNQDQITYNAKNVNHSVSWLDHTKLQEAWLFKSKTELLESL